MKAARATVDALGMAGESSTTRDPGPEWGFPNRATPPGSSAYYSVRFEPPALREASALLFAWRAVLREALTDGSDPGVARLKLQWWRDEIARGRSGDAAHPLVRRMAPWMRRHALPVEALAGIADTVEDEVRRLRPRDLAALEARAERDHGALFELIGRCHGITDPQRLAQLRRLGTACALVYLIRDLGGHRRRGLQPLPQTLPDDHREALPRLAARARELATPAAGPLPPAVAARTAILMALLGELERADYPVLDQRLCLTPLRKLWIAWRASRRGLG